MSCLKGAARPRRGCETLTAQISPTSWNFASTMSRSKGFMMYSSAPARIAFAIWAMSFSVVQKTTFGFLAAGQAAQLAKELETVHDRHVPVEEHGVGHRFRAEVERLLAVLGLGDPEVEPFEDAARDLADHAGVVDDETVLHGAYPLGGDLVAGELENAVDVEDDHQLAVEAMDAAGYPRPARIEVDGVGLAARIRRASSPRRPDR